MFPRGRWSRQAKMKSYWILKRIHTICARRKRPAWAATALASKQLDDLDIQADADFYGSILSGLCAEVEIYQVRDAMLTDPIHTPLWQQYCKGETYQRWIEYVLNNYKENYDRWEIRH